LDGVMEAPGGEPGYVHTGWVGDFFDDDLGAYKGAEQLATQTLVLGRTTYESFAGAWPEREGEMADKINTMEKVVLSTTIGDPGWQNVTVAKSLDEVVALKDGDGGDIIVVGSRTLAQALLLAGAVDELHLQVFPLILGSGRRLYPEGPTKLELELESSSITGNGVMLQEYLVASS
ncbi:MAG: dihydrofolate reductase family protein, partial [Solirubrobacteraceae bacterium]|nr:dihydrofolate reductase family protein [Solirubrobacteraceae bacterium]